MIGLSLGASLHILDLGLGASKIEFKMKYRQLSRIYHPDKNNQAITGLIAKETSEFFKLLNNANKYLKERL
jgi:DnaJ-class molecular chaperone